MSYKMRGEWVIFVNLISTNLLDEPSELVILWQFTSGALRGMGSREGLELVFYVALVFFQVHLLFDSVLRDWYEGLDDCVDKVFLKVSFLAESSAFVTLGL